MVVSIGVFIHQKITRLIYYLSMNYKQRVSYGDALSKMGKWNYTTFLRGQYKFNRGYVEKIVNKLIRSSEINKVFYSIEKDRNEEHNHLHLMLEGYKITRNKLSRIANFNKIGIGNIEEIKNKREVSRYVTKHIGKDFSDHDIII
jgi:hypothetical protein